MFSLPPRSHSCPCRRPHSHHPAEQTRACAINTLSGPSVGSQLQSEEVRAQSRKDRMHEAEAQSFGQRRTPDPRRAHSCCFRVTAGRPCKEHRSLRERENGLASSGVSPLLLARQQPWASERPVSVPLGVLMKHRTESAGFSAAGGRGQGETWPFIECTQAHCSVDLGPQ